jgi:hypothetical protein
MVNALLVPFLAIFVLQLAFFLFRAPRGKKQPSARGATFQRRLRLAGALVLVAGLFAAALVYRKAALTPEEDGDAIGYEVGPGYSYPITPGSTKHYDVQMEQIGGKGNVAAADIRAWCRSLGHGRRLAYTLAAFSAGGCLLCLFVARHPPD